jgi:hypothetical protein
MAGLLASNAWRLGRFFPRVDFVICHLLILSHILADFFLTSAPISFCWPLEVNWSVGHTGWADIFNSVLFESFQDVGIIIGCGALLILGNLMKKNRLFSTFGTRAELKRSTGTDRLATH